MRKYLLITIVGLIVMFFLLFILYQFGFPITTVQLILILVVVIGLSIYFLYPIIVKGHVKKDVTMTRYISKAMQWWTDITGGTGTGESLLFEGRGKTQFHEGLNKKFRGFFFKKSGGGDVVIIMDEDGDVWDFDTNPTEDDPLANFNPAEYKPISKAEAKEKLRAKLPIEFERKEETEFEEEKKRSVVK